MLFEITNLNNADILDYINKHYILPSSLKDKIQTFIDNVDDLEENDEDVEQTLEMIIDYIERQTGKKINYVLWLADKEAVRNLYDGDELEMYGYDVDDALILSDLGYDGTLYAFEDMPDAIEVIEPGKEVINETYNKLIKSIAKDIEIIIKKYL